MKIALKHPDNPCARIDLRRAAQQVLPAGGPVNPQAGTSSLHSFSGLPNRREPSAFGVPRSRGSDRLKAELRTGGRVSERAFTLVEIALSLAIIGFALVAIIGVLPAGLNVQKENREETVINQDGLYFLEAIRRGARELDDLTNYVDAITIDRQLYDAFAEVDGPMERFHFSRDFPESEPLTNGQRIIGLLSTPKYLPNAGGYYSNHVTAYVRAISGVAAEKAADQAARDFAFAYRLTSEVVPYGFYGTNSQPLGYHPPGQFTNARNARLNLETNLHEIRLAIRWPLRPPADPRFNISTNVGPSQMTFRTVAGGRLLQNGNLFFLEPQTYIKANLPE